MKVFLIASECIAQNKRLRKCSWHVGYAIVGNWKTDLFVLFDGEIEKHNCHPYWEIAYYNDEGTWFEATRRRVCDIRKRGLAVVPAVL